MSSGYSKNGEAIVPSIFKSFDNDFAEAHAYDESKRREFSNAMEPLYHAAGKSEMKTLLEVKVAFKTLVGLGHLWKGQTQEGIALVVSAIKAFNQKFPAYVNHYSTNSIASGLLDGYGKHAQQMVDHWQFEQDTKRDKNPLITLARFSDYGLSPIAITGATRRDPKLVVPDKIAIRIVAIIQGSEAKDDFWTPSSDTEANNRANTKPNSTPDKKSNKLRNADRLVQRMQKFFLANPSKCPNCFDTHALSDCTSLDDDASNNIAAYFWPDYEKDTTKKRTHNQRKYIKWIKHRTPQ